MGGLKGRKGFVDNRMYGRLNSRKALGGVFLTTVIIVIVLGVLGASFYGAAVGSVKEVNYNLMETSHTMIGKGGSTPYICYGNNSFVVLWFGKDTAGNWMLNATLIDAYGNVEKNVTLSTDVALYNSKPSGMGPRVAYDPNDNLFFAIWYSSNKSLDGIFMNPSLGTLTSPFVINGTVKVDYHAFGLTYIGNSKFLVIWNDAKYDNYYRTVEYNNGTPEMSSISKVSLDTSHSHLNDAVAYDPTTGNIMVIWRNSTGSSGVYNITGKIFDNNMSKVIRNDFTIANGFKESKGYDMPNIVGGNGRFMVIYANRNSPYGVYGMLINASSGSIMKTFEIGESYYGIKYYGMGVTYNGSGGFMVSWPGSDKNIMATMYSSNGTMVTQFKITNSTDSLEAPVVSAGYMPTRASNVVYQFVWYDYTTGEIYTANYQESVLVPEFSPLLPLLAVFVVGIIAHRRKRN